MRRATAIGLAVLVFLAFSNPAHSDTAKTIAEAGAAAALVGIICSSVALTADDEVDPADFARRGFLVGGAGTHAWAVFEDDAEQDFQDQLGGAVQLSVDDSFGFSGQVGYRCHRHFSAEVEVEWMAGFDGDITQPGFVQLGTVTYEPVVITTNVKGYILTGRYQPFLLLGAGAMTSQMKMGETTGLTPAQSDSESDVDFVMRFGGGIDVYATENWVVNLGVDYVLPFGDLDALDYVTIKWGFQYRF